MEHVQTDAEALAALKADRAKQLAKVTGWKPLTIWYSLWALLFTLGSLSGLFAGKIGLFFAALVMTGACALYARYLYNGGRHRVWFFIW